MKRIIVEQLNVKEEEVMNNASLVEDLGVDSLDLVKLGTALEFEFGTDIPDEEAPHASGRPRGRHELSHASSRGGRQRAGRRGR